MCRKSEYFYPNCAKKKNLTQEELGEQIGVINKTVSRWKNGNYLPPVEILQILSKKYDVSINEILSGERLDDEKFKTKAEENISTALENSFGHFGLTTAVPRMWKNIYTATKTRMSNPIPIKNRNKSLIVFQFSLCRKNHYHKSRGILFPAAFALHPSYRFALLRLANTNNNTLSSTATAVTVIHKATQFMLKIAGSSPNAP